MITQEWKISKLLDTYPETLKVLVAASPRFRKLNNKLLRKALAPRVSVGEAAAIGGVDAKALLAALNEAAGFGADVPQPETSGKERRSFEMEQREKPEALLHVSPGQEVLLDVRPILDSGVDPFKTIITTVKSMKPGQILHLVNSFEPKPLYAVLGQRGLAHWTEFSNGTFNVYFYQSSEISDSATASSQTRDISGGEKVIELDVRDLAPPEPMVRILETLSRVDANTVLIVHHHREPMLLYEKLDARGFTATTNKIDEHYYKVVIRKKEKDDGKESIQMVKK